MWDGIPAGELADTIAMPRKELASFEPVELIPTDQKRGLMFAPIIQGTFKEA
jgi:hypothetical protein